MSDVCSEGYFTENGLRRGARYDDIFYGVYAGPEATFDIRVRFDFKQKLNVKKFQQAADEALGYYPEFAVRPVIYMGVIHYEANRAPAGLFPDDGKRRYFGTEGEAGTNGYPFLFLYGEKHVTFSLFHGLTDAHGMIFFVISVLWGYLKRMFPPLGLMNPKLLTRPGIRLSADMLGDMDDTERYDPLVKFASDGEPVNLIDPETLFTLPKEAVDKSDETCRLLNLEISNKAFLKKTKALGTSFAPLLSVIAADAICSAYDVVDKVVGVVTTVDPRRLIKTNSLGNMAYNCPLPITKKDLERPLAELCARVRADMKKQVTEENARATYRFILSQCDDVRAMGDVEAVNKALTAVEGVATLSSNGTIFLTYPGRIGNNLISRVLLEGVTPEMLACERGIVVYAHRDSLIVQVTQKSDDMTLVRALEGSMRKYGFSPRFRDMGRVTQNVTALDRLKRVSS